MDATSVRWISLHGNFLWFHFNNRKNSNVEWNSTVLSFIPFQSCKYYSLAI
jgi:hypothetical protein